MPFLQEPTVKYLQDGSAAVSFDYSFGLDPVVNVNLASRVFKGEVISLDLGSLNRSKPIGRIRSIQLTADFWCAANSTAIDGRLYIYIPSTGQLLTFAAPASSENYAGVLTASIPVVVGEPNQFIFAKEVGSDNASLSGFMRVTLLTADQRPYCILGESHIPASL